MRAGKTVRVALAVAAVSWTATAAALPWAFVPNARDGTLSIVETADNTVRATVTGLTTPFGIAVHPNAAIVYVGQQGLWGTFPSIAVVDTNGATVVGSPIYLSATDVTGLATNRAGTRLYAATSFADSAHGYPGVGRLWVFNTTTPNSPSLIGSVVVGPRPYGVAVLPNSTRVYVAHADPPGGSGNVTVIDANNNVLTTIDFAETPTGIAVHPDGSKVYATAGEAAGTLAVIDTTTNTVTGTVTVGPYPVGVAVIPTGTKVYVANEANDTVSVISTATNAVTATISGFHRPYGLAAVPSGTKVYVVNECPTAFCPGATFSFVTAIDTASDAVTGQVMVGREPFALGEFFVPPCAGCC